jgi:hypothetical protein
MNALLIYPIFPPTFWSFEGVLQLIGRKALLPPLGLATVAALLPQDWNFRLVDRNVTTLTEADWAWADMVLLSGMIVQREDFLHLIRRWALCDLRAGGGRGRGLRLPSAG